MTGAGGDGVAPTETAALTEAERTGKPVQVLSKTGYTQEIMANPTGTLTATIAVNSIRAPKDGKWVPIDTSLQRRGDMLVPAAAAADVGFSMGGNGPFAWMERGGHRLALSWPYGVLPAPRVEENTATYEVFKDVDLQLIATADGFSHRLVVKTAEAAKDPRLAKIDLGLATSTVELKTTGSGEVHAVDPTSGGLVFQAPAPVMWESTGRTPVVPSAAPRRTGSAEAGSDSGEGRTAPVKAVVDRDSLVLEPDQGLLRDPAADFPLTIDPDVHSPKPNKWAMISDSQPTLINFPTEYKAGTTVRKGQGVGYCHQSGVGMGDCGNGLKKRLLFQFPSHVFNGYNILTAEFQAYQTLNYNGELTPVELWLTKVINGGMTWGNSSSTGSTGFWQKKLHAFTSNKGGPNIGQGPVSSSSASLRDTVQRSADGYWSTITLGLKSPNESNLSYWKRFQGGSEPAFAPVLRVEYNLPPNQPNANELQTVSEGFGHVCRGFRDPRRDYIRKKSGMRLSAYLRDTSAKNELLKGEFEVWWDGAKQRTYWTDVKPKGSKFETEALDSLAIPENKDISWRVRAWDQRLVDGKYVNQGVSPWSNVQSGSDGEIVWQNPDARWCVFIYDHTKPPRPNVISQDGRYPMTDPQDTNAPWSDGVGQYGRFKLSPGVEPGRPVDKLKGYWYTNGAGQRAWVPAAADGTAVVDVLPETGGSKSLAVEAVDLVDMPSEKNPYPYRVAEGKPNSGAWPLDKATDQEPDGELRDSSGNGHPASMRGGAKISPDLGGKVGESLVLNGATDYAETTAGVVEASQSFSVSAWVKLTEKVNYRNAVSLDDGTTTHAWLQYSIAEDRWNFSLAGSARTLSDAPPQLNEWTHLVGVYDAYRGQTRLYVNGKLQSAPTQVAAPLVAGARKVAIGRSLVNQAPAEMWPGEVDDVRVFGRIVTNDEVMKLADSPAQVKAWWKLSSPTDEIGNQHPLALSGPGPEFRPPAQDGRIGDGKGGLWLPATAKAFATTSGPVVNTDESFTITGWATPDHNPDADDLNNPGPTATAAVFSQSGAVNSAFTVRWHPRAFKGTDPADPESPTQVDKGGWQIEMPDKDQAADVTWNRTFHPSSKVVFGDQAADHLALVYEATSDTMTLYVNGQFAQRISELKGVPSFAGTKELRIGATKNNNTIGEFFPGLIDDVWAFQGALGMTQIGCLANPTEQQSPAGCLAKP
ncbi:LamG-like jellyroll fold domain-containing protein [Spirillospora sp. NPDC048911]|uniref:LamG domain-containing protein n=1 Tax=Spirillospora sp. NPDC048911 TaxID=3364527 RepID=UPI003716F8FD